LPGEERPSAPAPKAAGGTSRVPLIAGGVVAGLCVLALLVIGGLALQRDERAAVVQSVAWERAIEVEGFGPVRHEDWQENVPASATGVTCDLEYRGESDSPAPMSTEVCGTPYTVDEGSGYGQVVQDCSYRVYDQSCTYTVNEWTVTRTERASGDDLNPGWPAVRLAADERSGDENESYRVELISDDDRFTYSPETASEFTTFAPGSEWTITVNGLGLIVAIEAAP
jgi:hypothetical protein